MQMFEGIYQQPDAGGHFGRYGGNFVAETLKPALDETHRYDDAKRPGSAPNSNTT